MRTYEDLIENMVMAERMAPDSMSHWIERTFKLMEYNDLLEVFKVSGRRMHKDNGARTIFPYASAELFDRVSMRLNELERGD